MSAPLLSVASLCVRYDAIEAVKDVSFDVNAGEIVTLIGSNGAGKTSILRALSGMIPATGHIRYDGAEIRGRAAHTIVHAGIAHVPEGRGIFGNLTVHENLTLATWGRRDKTVTESDRERVLNLFPRLRERLRQPAGTLSGGEQQMLAVGRALMTRARLMLLDEPSMGLSPLLVREIFKIIRDINQGGTTILLVEQNARMSLSIAHRAHVLETGRITLSGTGRELLENPAVSAAYLGETKQ